MQLVYLKLKCSFLRLKHPGNCAIHAQRIILILDNVSDKPNITYYSVVSPCRTPKLDDQKSVASICLLPSGGKTSVASQPSPLCAIFMQVKCCKCICICRSLHKMLVGCWGTNSPAPWLLGVKSPHD